MIRSVVGTASFVVMIDRLLLLCVYLVIYVKEGRGIFLYVAL